MSIFQGDTGIKILENFNIFLSNQRNPIPPQDAHGIVTVQMFSPTKPEGSQPIQILFTVETTIPVDNFQIIDESKLAKLIGIEVQKIASLNFFGAAKVKVLSVAMATGYDNSFNSYPME